MILYKNKQFLLLRLTFLLCAICLLTAGPCLANPGADKNEVLVMGDSRIYTDVMAARSAAVSQCLTSAVQETAIGMIPFSVLAEKYETISDLLTSHRDQVISDYKVLKEIHTEKHYRVLVQVAISAVKLKEVLANAGIVISAENLPEILFLITEKQADDIAPRYWWREVKSLFQTDAAIRSMKTIFAEKGFPVIDDEMVPYGLFEDMALTSELTEEQALELGKRLNADIVIIGTAFAAEMSNRMGEDILTLKATVAAQGWLTETGEPIGRTTYSETKVSKNIAVGSSEALSDAGIQAGLDLTSQIMTEWHARMTKTDEITLTITGSDILPYLVLFRNKLKTIEGVTRQQTLEMTPDEAVLLVQYDKPSQELADALLRKTFEPFGINIYEISHNTLHIELVAR